MSQYKRNEINANSAIVAEVVPADFENYPLAGIDFQRHWEEKAFIDGGGNFNAPCQLVGDFLGGKPSDSLGSVQPSYLPGIRLTDLRNSLPGSVVAAIQEALPAFDKKIRGFILRCSADWYRNQDLISGPYLTGTRLSKYINPGFISCRRGFRVCGRYFILGHGWNKGCRGSD